MVIPGGAVILDGVKTGAQELVMSAARSVIEGWSKRRAQEFFDVFCRHIADAASTDGDIAVDLDNVLGTEAARNVVFDAYRSVCLCRSRILGPRVIAVLTAKLVNEQREANDDEDQLLAAAEELTDDELRGVRDQIAKLERILDGKPRPGEKADVRREYGTELVVTVRTEMVPVDVGSSTGGHVSLAPMNLAMEIGLWAAKLERIGLVYTDMLEKPLVVKEDAERHIDYDHFYRDVRWSMGYTAGAKELANLIDRADTVI